MYNGSSSAANYSRTIQIHRPEMTMLKRGAFFMCLVLVVQGAPAGDLISKLPGWNGNTTAKQYAGYLDASSTTHLFYWFVESQTTPASAPVMIWFNGGPGCSSVTGYFTEHGPFTIQSDGKTLVENPYSWNKLANVLYLDTPGLTGYSYDDNKNYTTNNDMVAVLNYAAVKDFYQKFPEYITNDVYIAGESYAGVYVPRLAVDVLREKGLNFKGFTVTNSVTNYELAGNSRVFFAYDHGIIGTKLRDDLSKNCCNGSFTQESCDFWYISDRLECRTLMGEVNDAIVRGGLNMYGMFSNCPDIVTQLDDDASLDKGSTMERQSDGVRCVDGEAIMLYMRKPEVRKALHVPDFTRTWNLCSGETYLSFDMPLQLDMTPYYKTVLDISDARVLVAAGDTDLAVNFLGMEWFVDSLNYQLSKSTQPWYSGLRAGGIATEFKDGQLTFTTIKGGDHMVAFSKPRETFLMMTNFLSGKSILEKHATS